MTQMNMMNAECSIKILHITHTQQVMICGDQRNNLRAFQSTGTQALDACIRLKQQAALGDIANHTPKTQLKFIGQRNLDFARCAGSKQVIVAAVPRHDVFLVGDVLQVKCHVNPLRAVVGRQISR